MDACTGTLVNYSNTPAEMIEAELPIAVERYGLVPDTGGAGSGGAAWHSTVISASSSTVPPCRSAPTGATTRPMRWRAARAGAPSWVDIRRAGGRVDTFPQKFLTTVDAGDVLRVRLAGGGGYGDPLARDPHRVLADVRAGKVTVAAALERYVVIAMQPPRVDVAATLAARQARPRR